MKLSIITISYNNLSGLKKTAQSILEQIWRDYEWIVIDGGSNDGTKEFLEQLSPQPDYWCSEKDNGIYDAQNKGIMRAKGDYVCCMNAGDTFCDSSTLKRVFKYSPNADVVYGDWKRVYFDREELCYSPKEMPPHFFFYDNICHQAMFVRTRLLQKDAFDLSYQIYADWAKWRQLMLEKCSFEYVPVFVCNFEANVGTCEQDTLLRKNEYKRLHDETPREVLRAISLQNIDYDVVLIGFYPFDNGTIIWRLNYLKDILENKGYKVVVTTKETWMKVFAVVKKSPKVILCRPSFDDFGNEVIRFCLDNKKDFVIDIDDALFHDEIINDGCFLSEGVSYELMRNVYKNIADCFLFADLFIVSTPKIQEMLWAKYGKKSIIRPNVIPLSLCNKKQRVEHSGLKLLYASGTPTHLYDFSTVYLDLLTFMKRHQDVTLTILGDSIRKEEMLWCSDRVKEIPYVPFSNMLEIYSEHDLVLVPLSQSEFNDAKSNIKYIEGGAVGVAVLAKDCAEFKSAIVDGVNGFLYHNDFLEKLEYIYENRDRLADIGTNAYNDVKEKCSTQSEIDKALFDWLDSY